LILDIFARNARSRDGKLQVELAQLRYLKGRLSEKDDNMSRLTGGIGGRGPGETKLEIGRRRVEDRIRRLEKELSSIKKRRLLNRRRRDDSAVPVCSIVGYTNAGKSTLLNRLTNSEVVQENRLFATLDPTTRRLRFPEEREIILTDTVGFIHDLPPELKKAFQATLEELADSDLLLHCIDVADPAREEKIRDVEEILSDLGLMEIPVLRVYNKCDRLSPARRQEIRNEDSPDRVFVSAQESWNLQALLDRLEQLTSRTPQAEHSDAEIQSTAYGTG
ncbi:MAG: GTPase HflX, partial [Leptospiraceae bacterium]|nr:GTPase HflX [Leptospiraceae bacterium]